MHLLHLGLPEIPDGPFRILETPAGTSFETVSLNLPSGGLTVPADKSAVCSESVYVRETDATKSNPGSKLFTISLSQRNSDGTSSTYNLVPSDLIWINRNDHVVIPIGFMDAVPEFDVHFYPPIGGYPANTTLTGTNPYQVKFGTEGLFEIQPYFVDASTGERMARDSFNVIISSISDPSGIFVTAPSIDTKTGEIIGEVGNKEGEAEVRLTLSLSLGAGTAREFPCTIRIVRSNN